ncbi:hypothetical protein JCM8547_005383 [Rhodosporidiobolus lusitaniae]
MSSAAPPPRASTPASAPPDDPVPPPSLASTAAVPPSPQDPPPRLADRFRHLGRVERSPAPQDPNERERAQGHADKEQQEKEGSPSSSTSGQSGASVTRERRKRAAGPKNCDMCRARKQKCDRLPSCSNCNLRGLTCTYEDAVSHSSRTISPLEQNRSDIVSLRRKVDTLVKKLDMTTPELNKLARIADLLVEADAERMKRRKRSLQSSGDEGGPAKRRHSDGEPTRLTSLSPPPRPRSYRPLSSSSAASSPFSFAATQVIGSSPSSRFPHPHQGPVHTILYPSHAQPAAPYRRPSIFPSSPYGRLSPYDSPFSCQSQASRPHAYGYGPSNSPVERNQHDHFSSRPRLPGFSTAQQQFGTAVPSSFISSASSSPQSRPSFSTLSPLRIPSPPHFGTSRPTAASGTTPSTDHALTSTSSHPSVLSARDTPHSSLASSSSSLFPPPSRPTPPPAKDVVYTLPAPESRSSSSTDGLPASLQAFKLAAAGEGKGGKEGGGIKLPPLKLALAQAE